MYRFNELIKKISEYAYIHSRFYLYTKTLINVSIDDLDRELDQFREENLGKYIASEKGPFGHISSQITMDNPKIEIGECDYATQPILKFKIDDSHNIVFPLLQQRYRVDNYPFLLFDDKDSLDLFYLIKEAPNV